MRRALLIASGLVVCGVCFGCGLLAGLAGSEQKGYQRRTEQERAVVAPLLAADPAFARLELEPRSDGGVLLYGSLQAADLKRLRVVLARAVGEGRADEVMMAIDVQRRGRTRRCSGR